MYPLDVDTSQLPTITFRLSTSLADTRNNQELRDATVKEASDLLGELNAAVPGLPRSTGGSATTSLEHIYTVDVALPRNRTVTTMFKLIVRTPHPVSREELKRFLDTYADRLKVRLRAELQTVKS